MWLAKVVFYSNYFVHAAAVHATALAIQVICPVMGANVIKIINRSVPDPHMTAVLTLYDRIHASGVLV